MEILLLETVSNVGENLRLSKEIDEGKYTILKGQYHGSQGRREVKGTYADLATALGVYCSYVPSLLKETG